MEDAFPVIHVLLREREIESIGMTGGLNVSGCSAFAKHLLDGIARHEVNEQKDNRNHQPEDREGVEQTI